MPPVVVVVVQSGADWNFLYFYDPTSLLDTLFHNNITFFQQHPTLISRKQESYFFPKGQIRSLIDRYMKAGVRKVSCKELIFPQSWIF